MSMLLHVGRLVAGLGREVEANLEASTLKIEADLPAQPHLLGLVRESREGVTIYAIHPRTVPEERLAAVAELATRASATEFTVAFEMDYTHRTVTARGGVELLGAQLVEDEVETLLEVLIDEVESVARCYSPSIDAVIAGTSAPAVAAAQGLSARRDERLAEAHAALTPPTPTSPPPK